MKYAGFLKRFISMWIDFFVFLPFLALHMYLISNFKQFGIFWQVVSLFLYSGYNVYFHGRWGQTVGKMVTGIKVVTLDEKDISWKTSFLRSSVDIGFAIPMAIGTLIVLAQIPEAVFQDTTFVDWMKEFDKHQPPFLKILQVLNNIWIWSEVVVLLFNKKKRALHDFIAGTVVVHKSSLSNNESNKMVA